MQVLGSIVFVMVLTASLLVAGLAAVLLFMFLMSTLIDFVARVLPRAKSSRATEMPPVLK